MTRCSGVMIAANLARPVRAFVGSVLCWNTLLSGLSIVVCG